MYRASAVIEMGATVAMAGWMLAGRSAGLQSILPRDNRGYQLPGLIQGCKTPLGHSLNKYSGIPA